MRLSAIRHDEFPQNNITFVFASPAVTTNASEIGLVVRVICALPKFPAGAISCPADLGISYTLDFQSSSRVDRVFMASPAGCPSLSGLGPTRIASPAFWDALASALSLPQPREYCDPFTGRLPGAPTTCGPPNS